jgi:hypothetical protein
MAALREMGSLNPQGSDVERLAGELNRNPKNLTRHGITSFGLWDRA